MMIHGWGSGGSGYRLLSLGNSRGARRSPQTIADGHPAWLAFWRLSCVVGGGGLPRFAEFVISGKVVDGRYELVRLTVLKQYACAQDLRVAVMRMMGVATGDSWKGKY